MRGYASPKCSTKSHLLIIDSKKLRQAGIMHLLDAWAGAMGLTISAVASDNPIETPRTNARCEIVILSIGSASVEDPHQQALIKSVRTLMPRTPLVVISDREEPKEVYAAFEAGAAGFIPTSIEPPVALQALSFIKCGGSFFPPSALPHNYLTSERLSITEGVVHGCNLSSELMDRPSKLSVKQEAVFRILRQGQSNKVIARQLGVSEATVKVHIRCIMRKLGLANRTQVAIAATNGSALTRR
jgi:DNA-binding NarL/FixJ family response regulator